MLGRVGECGAAVMPADVGLRRSTYPLCSIGGSPGADTIHGSYRGDYLYGGRGPDHLFGGWGEDLVVEGGPGADVIHGGVKNDSISGGPGNDVSYGELGGDTFYPGPGDDEEIGGDPASGVNTWWQFSQVPPPAGVPAEHRRARRDSRWVGSRHHLRDHLVRRILARPGDVCRRRANEVLDISSGATDVTADGAGGNDLLAGEFLDSGSVTLDGGPGNDKLFGADTNDTLNGGDGNDAIVANAGDDPS